MESDDNFNRIMEMNAESERRKFAAMAMQGIIANGTPLTCEEGGELMDVRPIDETEPETVDYWTATDPDGKQFTFLSKPVRRQWANGWTWEPSDGSSYIGEEGTKALMEMLRLPKLTWDDEPYKFTILKPKSDGSN